MADWRTVGRKIRDAHLSQTTWESPAGFKPKNQKPSKGDLARLQKFGSEVRALVEYVAGPSQDSAVERYLSHPRVLLEELRSDRPLSSGTQERIAQALESAIRPQPTKRGRPRNAKLRIATHFALAIYQEWKLANAEAGINDHGLGRQMKDESCTYALELLDGALEKIFGGSPLQHESVRETMDRTIHRQK